LGQVCTRSYERAESPAYKNCAPVETGMPPCQGANRNGVYNITQGVAVGLGYWGLSALFGE